MVLTRPVADRDRGEAEALFREARRRRRNRRLAWLGGILLILGAPIGGYFAFGGTAKLHRITSTTPTSPKAKGSTAQLASPAHPYGLAVGPNGTLYILDTGREQILHRSPSGTFEAFAGDGKRGFAGDGGPATNASIDISTNSGIVVGSDGAVYFSDSDNDRVREVSPDGIITTVAGGGTTPLSTNDVPALEASFGTNDPAGLALGPDGDLYIGAGAVYRLSSDGILQWVVGEPGSVPPPRNWGGVYSNPAIEQDFSPAVRLAFDGDGDLLVAGGGGFGLYERTASGALLFIENFRGDGTWGSLAQSPNGDVVLCARDGLSTFEPSGTMTPISVNLDAPLGRMSGTKLPNAFICGDGAAVAPDGTIYVDTNTGNAFTSVNAIVAVSRTTGSTAAVWKS
jgi:hypothetical protein